MDENIHNFIFAYIISIIIKFYANTAYPRDLVQQIIDIFKKFLIMYLLPCLKSELVTCIKMSKDKSDIINKVDIIFSNYERVFNDVDTEHIQII